MIKKIFHTVITYINKMCLIIVVLLFSQTANSQHMSQQRKIETITLGAGCFWCVEAVYERLNGVEEVISGYSGGHVKAPAYREVCNGTTGHAEVCQVKFNPEVISIEEILEVFFSVHDPTTLNKQGNDVGTQYRSAIFYHHDKQKLIAEKMIEKLNVSGDYQKPVVTEISPFEKFYEAEEYHQDYFANNPNQPYCNFVVNPKVKKFEKLYYHKLK